MRALCFIAAFAAAALPAGAQPAPAEAGRYDRAPWWMDKPIIAASGHASSELTANRASFSASYQVVDKDLGEATRAAAAKVKQLGAALAAYGADKVRVGTSFNVNPLYEQYRDKDGNLQENERADRIKTYQVSIRLSVELREVRLAEQVYATAIAAKPSSVEAMQFRLEPDDEAKARIARQAVADAATRARAAAEAAGARLGAVRLIDPTGRACETDVLVAGAPRDGQPNLPAMAYDSVAAPAPAGLQEVIVTSRKRAQELGLNPDDMRLPMQPPLLLIEASACVVYGLG